jgi:fructose-bisphosphate aldolase class II
MGVSFRSLGLANTAEMFRRAFAEKYAVPAYNFNNMEQLQAIITACVETRSPVILQVSSGARKYANQTLLRYMAEGAVKMAREMEKALGCEREIPITLHLDHGDTFELAQACVESGFSSVMIDGSHLPYEENITLTRRVVEYARPRAVSVEGELGVLAGIEDKVQAEKSTYTRPGEVEDFVSRTGVDSLAISIGTSHGPTNSSPSSAPATRAAFSSRRRCGSTFWKRSRNDCPASPSSSTALRPSSRRPWPPSTPMAGR